MNVALLLYTDFLKAKVIFYQILPCLNYLCSVAHSPFMLKHITSNKLLMLLPPLPLPLPRFLKHKLRHLDFICEGLDSGNDCPACLQVPIVILLFI